MFVSVYKSGEHQYCRLAESFRDENGKVKTKIIKNFGRVDLLEKNKPGFIEKLKQQYGGSKLDKIENHGKVRAEKLKEFVLNSSLDSSGSYPLLNYGYYVLKALWSELGLNRALPYIQAKHLKTEFDFNAVASFLVFSKVLDPHSVRFTFADKDFLIGNPMKDITLQNCYDTLGVMKEYKDKIFKSVNKRLDELYGKERSLLIFYDVTNAYFESPMTDEEFQYKQNDYIEQLSILINEARISGELGSEFFKEDGTLNCEYDMLPVEFRNKVAEQHIDYLLMRGPSKEHRYDLPIVSVALVIDRNGFPIDFEVYPGNASEFKTMQNSIKKLAKKYHAKQTIVVADRGLNSASNLKMLLDQDMGFLMAQKVSNFSNSLIEQMLDLGQYSIINENDPDFGKYRVIENYEKIIPGTKEKLNCTLLLTYNEKRRARDEMILNRQIEKVQKKAEKKEKINPSSSSCAELALVDSKEKTAKVIGVDEKAVARIRKRCGFAAMVFKQPPVKEVDRLVNHIDEQSVAGVYHQLTRIEECFRIMKNNLGLRPMFVWNSDHVRGHITICVLALLLVRMLQNKLGNDFFSSVSIDQLCQALNEANVMFLKPSTDECIFIPQMSRTSNIRRGFEQLSDEQLSQAIDSKKIKSPEQIINRCMRAVGLHPLIGMVNRPDLAHCLKTRFNSDQEVVSPILLKQIYPTLYTTIQQK